MDVAGLLHLLRRRAIAILLCLVAGAAGGVLRTSQTPEVYRAEARVVVNIPAASNITQGAQGLQLTSQLLPTYAQIATSRGVATKVKDRLGLPESAETVRKKLEAKQEQDTLLIDIFAKDRDPVRARSIADAVSVALSEAVADLERERTAGSAIKVAVLDAALTPHTPVEPRPKYNLVLGLLLGAAAGLALALVLDALDRSVKTSAQAETASGAPVLGLLPKFKRGSPPVIAATEGDDPAGEAYRSLRTGVRFLDPDNPLQVLLVTSASAGEGKTTVAVNLAIALAQSGERVALVDADLRRAAVAVRLGIEGAVGLTTVVTRRVALEDALQDWQGLLAALPSGDLPPNPSEIVGSQSMGAVLDDLRTRFDVVLVDAPPVLPVTDAVVLSTQVDGVLLVTRAGKTQRQLLTETRRRLEGVGASVVGVVLNGVATSTAQGYYADYRRAATNQTGLSG